MNYTRRSRIYSGTRNEHSTPLEGIKVMGREGKKGLRDWQMFHNNTFATKWSPLLKSME